MHHRVLQIYNVLIFFQLIHYSTEVEYEFFPDDEWIYKKCKDIPDVLDMSGLFDMSNLNLTMIEEGIHFSGNMTSVWPGIDPSDRVQMAASIQYFDRGTWVPTILNMLVSDFCRVMYDDKQLWYKPWSSHIINRKDIEENCLKVSGTIFVFETFTAVFTIGSGIALRPGRYLVRIQLSAFDKFDIKRPAEICIDMTGRFFKV